jgi:NADH-quinone oxidoreductase subunit E
MTQQSSRNISRVVGKVLTKYPKEPSSLIGVLQDIQESLNYLPREALERVAAELKTPLNQPFYVATFYKAFSLKPRGKHIISICRGTACHVRGADKIADILRSELGVNEDETTEDGLFTVQSVRCLGCCSLAPAIMIDGDVFGRVTAKTLKEILARYRKKKK